MLDRLKAAIDRFDHLTAQLADPDVIQNSELFRKLSQERASIEKLVALSHEYMQEKSNFEQALELSQTSGDLAELAQQELYELKPKIEELEKQIRIELLPKDPDEEKNVILEIRAGAGGDEASLFAMDLFRMYLRFAQNQGWRTEVLSESFSGQGGYKEVSASIEGQDVYRFLQYESGVHRVQRIPVTEASGRIHTSTVTVAVLPEAEDVEIDVQEKDLRIDVYRSSGPGGQSVNTTDSAVRITHLPTGIVVAMQDEKSQHKNKEKAMKVLKARLFEAKQAAADAERSQDRRSQVGTGDRSEKIRTYNFPQSRITDHRIKLSISDIPGVLAGDIDQLIDPVVAFYQAEALRGEALVQ